MQELNAEAKELDQKMESIHLSMEQVKELATRHEMLVKQNAATFVRLSVHMPSPARHH